MQIQREKAGVIKTQFGKFLKDPSGLWHYKLTGWSSSAEQAAKDALKHRPEGACWFWFNGIPAPMNIGDTLEQLVLRWRSWRNSYQSDYGALLYLLEKLT